MQYTLRPYQREAVDEAVSFLKGPKQYNAIEVLPTGSGKSLIIANIVKELGQPVLIFQPSKEILDQNLSKIHAYGYDAAVYSASMGRKEVSNITLATIGSVAGKNRLFDNFRYIIVDECHKVNSNEGIYRVFLNALIDSGAKVLGLTATPYRLESTRNSSNLRFLTMTTPRIFEEMIYYVQNRDLFDSGYLARLEYSTVNGYDRSRLITNYAGSDFTDESIFVNCWASNLPEKMIQNIEREKKVRKNILVFTRFIKEAQHIVNRVSGAAIVTGETPKKEREKIINGFKSGNIRVVCNVGVLAIGFDFPELETVIIGRPTMSLALFYQMVGRSIRIHEKKECAKVIDMCGNYDAFGRIEDLKICPGEDGAWFIENQGRQLTN